MNIEMVNKIKQIVAEKAPAGGGMTLPANADEAAFWGMGAAYGIAHLDEAVEALEQFEKRGLSLERFENLVGLNSGVPMIEALLVAQGAGGGKVVLVDRPAAGARVAAHLFQSLGLEVPMYASLDGIADLPKFRGGSLLVCSHGLNVNHRHAELQADLERQNLNVLDGLAQRIDAGAALGFFSLEPGHSKGNHVRHLATPWLGKRALTVSEKAKPVNRTPGSDWPKICQFWELGQELAVLTDEWMSKFLCHQSYGTGYGMFEVTYAPPAVEVLEKFIAGVGWRMTLRLEDAQTVIDEFDDFERRKHHAVVEEELNCFGEASTW